MALTIVPTNVASPIQTPIPIQQKFRYLLVLSGGSDVDIILTANQIREAINLRYIKAYDFGQLVSGATVAVGAASQVTQMVIQTSDKPIPNLPAPPLAPPTAGVNIAHPNNVQDLATAATAQQVSSKPLPIKGGFIQNLNAETVWVGDSTVQDTTPWNGTALKACTVAGDGSGGVMTIGPIDLSTLYWIGATQHDKLQVYYEN